MTTTTCPACTLPVTRQSNISRLLPCNTKFHLKCFQTDSPCICPVCREPVEFLEILFPVGATTAQARLCLKDAGIDEERVTVLIEQVGEEGEKEAWKGLEKEKSQ
ncbi:hypothetical protein BDD12DRAFT_808608 [Trichophaea hybrida]|nr:hypothetical protein BDD12DRAFT_808608 [Trichophaea hybrida]